MKKDVSLDVPSSKLVPYIDLGQGLGPHESDEVPMATEALVFMAVGFASPSKIPIEYFLTNGAPGQLLNSLLEDAILVVEECGLHSRLWFDRLGANIAITKLLRCRVHETNYKSPQPAF